MSSSTPSTTTTATIATSLAALTLGAYFYQRRFTHTSTSTCTSESTQTRHLSTLVETKSNTIDHLLDSSNDANVKKQEVHVGEVYHPHPHIVNDAYIASFTRYQQLYQYSIEHNDEFWSQVAKKQLDWFTPFTQTKNGSFIGGNPSWYLNGQLNACYNAVDRHVKTQGDKIAILWEGDDSKDVRRVTYSQLLDDVSQFSNVLKRQGVRKGDAVCIYMPNIPEGIVAMLACARIGAVHSVVFAGFSADALRDRIQDAKCTVLITADEFYRAGKQIPLKAIADKALEECPDCKSVIVYKRTNTDKIQMKSGRDIWWHEAVAAERPYCPCEWMDAEDTLFYLYTSGSTGKPKGILHTTAGYLVYASFTHKYAFDVRRDDIYACMADIGWVTGHSYIVYGPLCNGNTTFQFEGMPAFPNSGRYWDMVERHKINVFYTAPTALRAIMRDGNTPVQKYDRSSLRVLGSVGEPINPEAWRWYNDIVGNGKCAIVDTYWQTETGGFLICPIPGAIATKPGSATLPFFGVEPAVLDPATGQEIKETEASGVLAIKRPWPGMARTIFGDHDRFRNTYLTIYPGYYFTGDGCMRDKDGYYWITGRVDDVVNVSGHRIGSAEIESVLVGHPNVAESAVIGIPHEIKGQALFAYVTLKNGFPATPELVAALKLQVRQHVGAFAVPDHILLTPALPKTRSGKIMRRLLRKIATQDTSNLGDISTLADETVVQTLIDAVNNMYKKK